MGGLIPKFQKQSLFQYIEDSLGILTLDLIAQLVEHETFNFGVEGSSPSGVTKSNLV